ncbi:alpha/beta hydrolase [Nannocystis exedens]|uniref:alpha/beta hydrolase n=1 Tax=Nannocystis exedens TaxID=54 RepID=UPI000BB9FEED|nr:dienelactone hydrolase family protein [Nannocystis exedens]PCC66471.1 putative hydrolase [Nannocystis exedens]
MADDFDRLTNYVMTNRARRAGEVIKPRSSNAWAWLLGGGLLAAGVGVAVAAGGKKKTKPLPDGQGPGNSGGGGQLPPPGVLQFDLESNWGGFPMSVRKHAARAELASGIPGLARALAIKWWQAFRATQPLVSTAQAATIAAAHPDLCRLCVTPADGPKSAQRIDANLANGWPVPKDVAGWKVGSYGLGDVLGASAVWQGIEDAKTGPGQYDRARMPLIDLEAAAAMQRWDVQGWLGAVLIWQHLSGPLKVLVPGKEANPGDSWETWGNLFSAYADPAGFAQGQGLPAKQRYLARATEIGIDLAAVAFPWPPGKSYKHPDAFSPLAVWQRLQAYQQQDVVHANAQGHSQPSQGDVIITNPEPGWKPPPLQIPVPKPPAEEPVQVQLPGLLLAKRVPTAVAGDAPAPLVLVFHGRGAQPDQLAALIPPDLGGRAYLVRGLPSGDAFGWFMSGSLDNPQVANALVALTPTLVQAIQTLTKLHRTTRIIAAGYDQGAAIALRLAAIGAVDGAVAVAGALPELLRPKKLPTQARVRFIHGAQDESVPLALAEATRGAFASTGMSATMLSLATNHALAQLEPSARTALVELVSTTAPRVGFELTDGCQLVVSDLGPAVAYIVPAVIEEAQERAATWAAPVPIDEIRVATKDVMVAEDPACGLGPIPPLAAADATRGFLVTRALYQAMVFRGLILTAFVEQLLDAARQEAATHGAPVAEMPDLGF